MTLARRQIELAMTNRSGPDRPRPRVIMHTSEPSGLGHYVSKVVLALAQFGVPVVLFCPANSRDEAPVRAAGVEVVHAADRPTSHAGLLQRILRNFTFLAKTAAVQFRLVRRGDIVHFQGILHLPLGFVFLLITKLRAGSVVLTAHDPLPHRWRFPRWLQWVERGMLHLAYRASDRIIVHNRAGRDALIREFHLRDDHIAVIPHGPYAVGTTDGGPFPDFRCLRLLAFGSIRKNKGLHLAIQAVQTMTCEMERPLRLTLAGLTDPAERHYWEQCKQIIAAQPDGIEVIERLISDEEVGPLLTRHHAVLLPYTKFFSESGVAALALSHRRPILATSAGGLGELIEHGAGVIPIASPTVASVAQAISVAMQLGPERLEKMGIEGAEFIRKARSWESIAAQTASVYSQLTAGASMVAQKLGAAAPAKALDTKMTADQAPSSLVS